MTLIARSVALNPPALVELALHIGKVRGATNNSNSQLIYDSGGDGTQNPKP